MTSCEKSCYYHPRTAKRILPTKRKARSGNYFIIVNYAQFEF